MIPALVVSAHAEWILRADEIEVVEHFVGLRVPGGAVGYGTRRGPAAARRWPSATRAAGSEIVGGDANAEKRSRMVGARGSLGGRDQSFGCDRCGHLRVQPHTSPQ